jgi:sugar (pentulose or hexulose) kinase
VGFELRKNIEVFKEIGIDPNELRLTGGGSRSDLWNQVYSDILGITCIRNVIEEATSLGAAILAASGAGIFPDITKAAENLCKIDKKWNPNGDRHNSYEELYRYSCELYNILESNNLYKKLDDIFRKIETK